MHGFDRTTTVSVFLDDSPVLKDTGPFEPGLHRSEWAAFEPCPKCGVVQHRRIVLRVDVDDE